MNLDLVLMRMGAGTYRDGEPPVVKCWECICNEIAIYAPELFEDTGGRFDAGE